MAGIVTVILLVVSAFLIPQAPRIDSPTAKFVTWITAHRRGAETAMVLNMFAAGTLLWFVSHLRHVLNRAEGGAEAFAPVVFGSGLGLAAVLALSSVPTTVLALMAGERGGLTAADSSVVRLLMLLSQVMLAPVFLLAAVFLAGLGAAILRHELLSSWLGSLALVLAAVNAVTVIGVMASATYSQAWLVIGFAGFLGFALVILVASAQMLRVPETSRAVEHPPVFSPA
jgi:hypothetical protein